MRTSFVVIFILSSLSLTGCDKPSAAASIATVPVTAVHKYEIRGDGVPGVQLDMLLVWQPERDNPKRLVKRITFPFSETFEGTGGWAWFDSLPNGASGKAGDTYKIDWLMDGDVGTTVEGVIKPENSQSDGMGRW